MSYILLSVVLALLCLEFLFWRSFIRPATLLLVSFLLASSLIVVNNADWDVNLSPKFMLYVLTALLSFLVSVLLVDAFYLKERENVVLEQPSPTQIRQARPSKALFILGNLSSLLFIVLTLRELGGGFELTAMLNQIYQTTVENNGDHSFLLNQLLKISTGVATISFYQLLLDRYVIGKQFNQLFHYMNIIFFLLVTIISTDRNILLRFFIYCIVLWVMFYTTSKKGKDKYIYFKLIRKLVTYLAIFMVIFYIAGKMKGYTSNFQRVVSIYAGSGLYNFSFFLDNFTGEQLQMGKSTFSSLLNTLHAFGFSSFVKVKIFEEFIVFRSSTGYIYVSNIYSIMRPFLEDFGYFGMVVFPMFLGFLYQKLYQWTKKTSYGFSWVMYASLCYPLVYFTIADQFFSRLHLGLVYEVFWVSVCYAYISRNVVFKFGSHRV